MSDHDHEHRGARRDVEAPSPGESPTPQQHFALALRRADGRDRRRSLTTIIAFLMGGLVVALTGKNPFKVYHAIFNGTGLNWFFHVGNHSRTDPVLDAHDVVPVGHRVGRRAEPAADAAPDDADHPDRRSRSRSRSAAACSTSAARASTSSARSSRSGSARRSSALNPFAARDALPRRRHARRRGLGGDRRHPQGDRRGARGDLDDHAQLDRDLGRLIPVRRRAARCRARQASIPISNDIVDGREAAGLLGARRCCRGSRSGSSSRVAMLVVYWVIINRTTLGFEVRAVGFNPEAARYGGISVARNYFLAMAISGAFAGLAGALDITGWEYRIGESDIHGEHDRLHRPRRRAARPQHRGRRRLRVAALRRADQRHLGPPARPVDLPARARRQPDDDHPGARHPLRRRSNLGGALRRGCGRGRRRGMTAIAARVGGIRWTRPEDGRHRRHRARRARVLARAAAARVADAAAPDRCSASSRSPPGSGRGRASERRVGGGAVAAGVLGIALGVARDALVDRAPRQRRRLERARSPRRCATRRRSRSPRSAASSASAAA